MHRALLVLSVCLACVAAHASSAPTRAQPPTPSRNLAILIFNGVQTIDYSGPYEVFGHVRAADQALPFNVYTVAERRAAVTTAQGMSVNPKFSIDEAPKADILVIPGGDITAVTGSAQVMSWVKASADSAQIVMSVCNGAFILARAGLLDGLEATTTATLIERLQEVAPRTRVTANARFVDNGKVITTAGLSSGIDGSLHVVERLFGRGTAEIAALAMEYNWDPNSTYARAALADKYLPNQFDIESVTRSWVPLHRSGGVDKWESDWSATSAALPSELLRHLEEAFSHREYFPRARHVSWQKLGETLSASDAQSVWQFSDESGKPWKGTVDVKRLPGRADSYVVSVAVQRASTHPGPPWALNLGLF